MMRAPINWSDTPSERPPMLKVVRAPVSGRAEWTILSVRVFGVFIHWHPRLKRNQPCIDPYGCICQEMQVSVKWCGYVAAQEIRGGTIRLLEFPSDGWIRCQGVSWQEHRGTMRGTRVVMRRERPDKNARVVLELHEPVVEALDALPPEPNVKDELQRIWGAKL